MTTRYNVSQATATGLVLLDGEGLVCPRCGEGYLHQGPVRVYSRREDCDGTLTTVECEAKVSVAPFPGGRMPGRRQSLEIDFYCEICGDNCYDTDQPGPSDCSCGCGECQCGNARYSLTLRVMQHKGCTLVSWVRM